MVVIVVVVHLQNTIISINNESVCIFFRHPENGIKFPSTCCYQPLMLLPTIYGKKIAVAPAD